MKNIIFHELQQFLHGVRLPVTLGIVLLMFAASSVTYINEHGENLKKYHEIAAHAEQWLRSNASNASNVAINVQDYRLPPRDNSFISDCGESGMPNTLAYSAFEKLWFRSNINVENPLIPLSDRVDWGFILTVLFSFLAIIFSFDALSGEKERHTLVYCLSNPVKRSHILLAKYIAINALLIACALVGILLALLVLVLSPSVSISAETISETGLFLLFVIFFTGSMSALGLFSSVTCHHSNTSLLLSVSLWLVFMIAIPSLAQLLGTTIWPVEKKHVMDAKSNAKAKEIEDSFPGEKWNVRGNDPFHPSHEIRANMMMAQEKSHASFQTAHYAAQFRQVENIRRLTWISPLAVFEHGMEALLDGGYARLHRDYDDLRNFKIQYLQWFKDFDARDDQSPHWYNPLENYATTRKAVSPEEIPRFAERRATVVERLSATSRYLAIQLAYAGVMLLLTLARFERYDVR
jgi:ABC-type transport system involved in multi-copper enzyme maturation permease subunit